MITKGNRKSETSRTVAVLRLAAKSAYSLRIREQRCNTVTPARTASNARHYSAEGIDHLKLMKRLVDARDVISSIAGLNDVQLQQCLSTNQPALSEVIGMDDVITEAAI